MTFVTRIVTRRVYLAGPMTGLPDLNYPAFLAAAESLRDRGYEVFNPAENFGGDQTLAYATYFRTDLGLLLKADALALLPGWERSRGACLELALAQVLDLPVLEASSGQPLRPTIDLAGQILRLAAWLKEQHQLEDFLRE